MRDDAAPQGMAYQWISDLDPVGIDLLDVDNDDGTAAAKLVQRYAVAVVGFALVGDFAARDGSRGLRLLRGGEGGGVSGGLSRGLMAQGWFSGDDECSWPGITCDALGSVSDIRLPGKDLEGTVPTEIGAFARTLTYLDLAENMIGGTMPDGLYDCTELEGLFLEHNQLTGSIGDGVGQLQNLKKLYLGNNRLEGTLPGKKMDNLRQLSE